MTNAFMHAPIVHAVGTALVQFVWQGAVIGASAALLLALSRRAAPTARYAIACAALAAMFITPLVTTAREVAHTATSQATVSASIAGGGTPPIPRLGAMSTGSPAVNVASSRAWIEPSLPPIVLAWSLIVLALSLRLARSWMRVERVRRSALLIDDRVRDLVNRLAERLNIRAAIRLVDSAHVDVPAVIGWLRPTIVVPLSVLGGLSPAQLEAILAHELAHVRRRDYLVNVVQHITETLLFFHPAVWWVSRQVRIEREHCCDDLAAACCESRVAYVDALASLEESRQHHLAFGLSALDGSLLQRARRLLEGPREYRRPPVPATIAITLSMVALLLSSGRADTAAEPVGQSATPSPSATATAPSTAHDETQTIYLNGRVKVLTESGVVVEFTGQGSVTAPGPTASAEAQLRSTEEALLQAKVQHDGSKLRELVADAFQGTISTGDSLDKAGLVRAHTATADDITVQQELGRIQQISDRIAIVSGWEGTVGSSEFVLRSEAGAFTHFGQFGTRRLFTHVWQQNAAGRWQLVSTSESVDPKSVAVYSLSSQTQNAGSLSYSVRRNTSAHTPDGQSVPMPSRTRYVPPVLPAIARAARMSGSVLVQIEILKNGNVGDVKVLRSAGVLDQAAIDAVSQWDFAPTLLNGEPVEVIMTATIEFGPPSVTR